MRIERENKGRNYTSDIETSRKEEEKDYDVLKEKKNMKKKRHCVYRT